MAQSYCVYIHVFPNGKCYIGQCQEPPEKRWRNGRGYLRQKLVHRAIVKYGWDNIEHKILYSELSQEDAYEKEMQSIKKFNTNAIRGGDGYNMSDGGESGSKGYKHTEETKARISQKQSGVNNGFYNKKHSAETKHKIGSIHKNKIISKETRQKMSKSRSGVNHFQYGIPRTDETKRKLSKANMGDKHPQFGMRGRNNPHAKKFLCIEIGVVYGCLSEIKEDLQVDASHVSTVCKGKRLTACGYHWAYAN